MSKVRTIDLMRISLRLALLQSTWCEGGMQSVGLTYCLIPGLQRLSPTAKDLAWTVQRHQEPFNTHPFLVGVIAGATLKLQEEGRNHGEIVSFLRSTMGPLAALGDPFFRTALPALTAVTASLAAMFFGILAGIVTLILMFNAFHVFIRLSGVFIGYREGYLVLPKIGRWISPARTVLIKTISAVGVGVFMTVSTFTFGTDESKWIAISIVACGILIAFALKKWPLPQAVLLPVALTIALCIEVLT